MKNIKHKELDLFKDADFAIEKRTYIKCLNNWYLFDDVKNRTNFSVKKDNCYMAACRIFDSNGEIFDASHAQCRVAKFDKKAVIVDVDRYLTVSKFLKNKKAKFNKKLGKLIKKNL